MEDCIVKTLSYFDVFDYPLTFSQLKKYLCCPIDVSDEELLEIIDSIPVINEFEGYYYLLGRSKLVSLRNNRNEISNQKFIKAKIISKLLSMIPTVDYIGVNGRLSMHNASSADNIDLLIVSKNNSLWLTRFFVNSILLITQQKSSKKYKKDRICTDVFLSRDSLSMRKFGKNIYLAHEIAQTKTLFDRGMVRSEFLRANSWIRKYFPNIKYTYAKNNSKGTSYENFLYPFERLAYLFQKPFVGNKKSMENVSANGTLLYSVKRRKAIMQVYNARKRVYLSLLKENYWIDNTEARFYLDEKKIRILN